MADTTSDGEDRTIVRNTWMSIAMVLAVLGNLLLIVVISRNRRFHNVTNQFNLNLSLSDLVKVFLLVPVYLVYADLEEWPTGRVGCQAITAVVYSSFGVSILTLMCLSYERYRLIVHPGKRKMTVREAFYCIAATWAISLVLASASIPFYDISQDGRLCSVRTTKNWNIALLFTAFSISQIVPAVFFLVTYVIIIMKLRRDAKNVVPRDQSSAARNRTRRNIRAIKILVIEAVLWVVCLMPFIIMSLVEAFDSGLALNPFSWKYLIMNCVLVLQTLVNPTLHFIFLREFRNELRRMLNTVLKYCHCNQIEPNDLNDNETTAVE